MDPETLREVLAASSGISPEEVTIHSIEGKPYDKAARHGKAAVAFSASRWNSSWDPKAAKAANN
jgi:hypothetical protein